VKPLTHLQVEVERGRFREDLLARINLWTFRLPPLHERPEDILPNLLYELDQASQALGTRVTMTKEAQEYFLRFATSPQARWSGNFRDLNAAVLRMATLAPGGRITRERVEEELERLRAAWARSGPSREAAVDLVVDRARSHRRVRGKIACGTLGADFGPHCQAGGRGRRPLELIGALLSEAALRLS
jgi:sigma54-dependent transcription regulator